MNMVKHFADTFIVVLEFCLTKLLRVGQGSGSWSGSGFRGEFWAYHEVSRLKIREPHEGHMTLPQRCTIKNPIACKVFRTRRLFGTQRYRQKA